MSIFIENFDIGNILFSDEGDTSLVNRPPYNVYIKNYYSCEEEEELLNNVYQTLNAMRETSGIVFDECCYRGNIYYFPEAHQPMYVYNIRDYDKDKEILIMPNMEPCIRPILGQISRFQDVITHKRVFTGFDKTTLKNLRSGKTDFKSIISILVKARLQGVMPEIYNRINQNSARKGSK